MEMNFSKNISMGMPKATPSVSRNFAIEAGLLLVVCALFIWFLILPKRGDVKAKQGELETLQQEQIKVQAQTAKLKELVRDLQSNKDNISKLDKALPLKNSAPQLELLIKNMADSSGVNLVNFNLAGSTSGIVAGNKELLADQFGAKRELQKLSGSVSVIGNFGQLVSFIEKLETSGRLFNISDIQFDSATEGVLNLRVGLSTYYYGL